MTTAAGEAGDLHIETFAVGDLGCNCSLLVDRESGDAIVIDPGGDFERIRERLEALGATPRAIVHTHTHIDHVGATAPLARLANVTPQIHEHDRFLYDMLPIQAALVGGGVPAACDMKGDLLDERTVSAGRIELAVLHTPGHTPGSISFLLRSPATSEPVVFTGDTLFRGSIGRTDLWGGDTDLIMRSLRERLMTLDGATRVVAGHGPDSNIEAELRSNPFLRISR
jgi:glyoxylase-like metal-dependent hydrolase (beta-lactamase superfamily II)